MKKKKKKISWKIVSVLFFLLTISTSRICSGQKINPATEELASRIEDKYNALKTLSIRFEQETSSPEFSTLRRFTGKMYLKNPNKFRIELSSQTVVSDGEYIWVYSEENKQVTKNLVNKSSEFFQPNDYLFNFRKNYDYRLEGEEEVRKAICYRMVYTSRDKDKFFKKIIVFFEKNTLLTKKIEYQDQNDNYTTLFFKDIKINQKLSDSKFVFEPPPGVEFIDLSELGDRE
ncbi:MAG: outer membrane lipoprotein carrier protein LolA [candidate division Zixibacteria bacterium]|nr:outer membrane lipoprotein carrier protein LolA [candidate division Zixibacteria bacterium]